MGPESNLTNSTGTVHF